MSAKFPRGGGGGGGSKHILSHPSNMSALELSAKGPFSLDRYQSKIWVENSVLLFNDIRNRNKIYLRNRSAPTVNC